VRRPSTLDIFDASDMLPALFELRHTVIEPILGRARKSAWPSAANSRRHG
jgi:hypothetical protein